jgi:hypothetical protein
MLLLAGCSKKAKDGATCDQVGARLFELTGAELELAARTERVDPDTRTLSAAQLPAMRDSIVRHCKDDGWSPEIRGCFVAAADGDGMTICYQRLPDEQRARLDRSSTSTVE